MKNNLVKKWTKWIIEFCKLLRLILQKGPEKVFKMILFDPLTGLYNRRALESFGLKEIERAKRGQSFSLIVLDVDYFKSINDTFGHLAGDKALKKVADFLKQTCRSSDLIFRYGGDEFLIIAPTLEANRIVQRIKEKLLSARLDENGKVIALSLSYGIASSTEVVSFEDWIRKADIEMYKCKNSKKQKKLERKQESENLGNIREEEKVGQFVY